jgi:hypothetical protein
VCVRDRRHGDRTVVLLLLGAFAVLCVHGLIWDSPTVDEFTHLPAGLHYLETGRFELGSRNPPLVKVLAALPPRLLLDPQVLTDIEIRNSGWYPWIYGTVFMEQNRPVFDKVYMLGRLSVVAIVLLMGAVVYLWSRDLYGPKAGLVALTFFAFCPTLIGHAHVVTIDAGAATFIALALFLFYRFVKEPTLGRLVLAGIGLGLAEITKMTALFLYPLLLVLTVVSLARGWRFRWKREGEGTGTVLGSLAALFLIFVLSLLVINTAYGFQGTGRTLGEYQLASSFMKRLAGIWPASFPVPLPYAYMEGFDSIRLDTELGEFPNYLFGRWSREGTPYYFLVAFLFKTPLLLVAALFAAPFLRLRDRKPPLEAFVWLPLLLLFAFFSLFSLKVNYGIRHILPTFPLVFIYASRWTPFLAERPKVLRSAAVALLALYPVSALLATPDTLSYFNVLAGDRPDRILLDSNLDWGQGLKRVKAYMDREGLERVPLAYFGHVDPGLYGIEWDLPRPDQPGPVVVSANFLHGYAYVTYYRGRMRPLREGEVTWIAKYPRVEDLGGGMYVYQIGEGKVP